MNEIRSETVNFASASDHCTAITGTGLLRCPEIEYVGPRKDAARDVAGAGHS